MMGSQGEDNSNTPMGGNGGMNGTFIDSPVQGLAYTTPSASGITGENGQFFCNPGEMIQFMIGDVMLGEIQAKDVITPMDFVDPAERTMGFNHPMLVNMGRFLQSLDADANPENGITITDDVRNEMRGLMIDFHQSILDFETDPNVMTLFVKLNGLDMPHNGTMWELVDVEGAQQHMIDHMSRFMDGNMGDMMDEHMGQGTPGTGAIDMPMDNMGSRMDEEMIDYMNEHMGLNQDGTGGNPGNPMNGNMGGGMGGRTGM